MSLLTCENLSVGYDNQIVVKDINFSIEKGDYLCIIGENGSGKTTLMKAILKLKNPISGSIITGDGLVANQVGYLPQQTVVQKDFPATVREVVLMGCLNKLGKRLFFSKKEKELAYKNMELMGITDIANKCYRELSGGQQQRVLLARALCATSSLLVLDEPVSGLDSQSTANMYALISKLNREHKITIIMVTHDIGAAMKNSNKILHIGHKATLFSTISEFASSDIGKAYALSQEAENA